MDILRQIIDRLDVVETIRRRGAHLDNVSDDEGLAPNPNLEPKEDQDNERLLRALSRAHSKLVIEVVLYDGKFGMNIVLNFIFDRENFFEFENTSDNRRVKISLTRLNGHASL